MPASVHLDLSRALVPALDEFNPGRWVELPASVRTLDAFESLLRGRRWSSQLIGGRLQFLRAGGVVEDTGCLIGDLIEVVADSSGAPAGAGAAQIAAGERMVGRQAGSSSGDQREAPATGEGGAASPEAAATSEETALMQQGAEALTLGATGAGHSEGQPVIQRQEIRQSSRPERLMAAERMSVEERTAVRAAGVSEEAMEEGKVLPALQRLGGHGPPIEVGHNRRCAHCGVLKPRVMYAEFMWNQPVHRSVCSHCETHLKCSTCPEHCCIKRPKAFSKRQARWWGGGRRCKECIAAAEAQQRAAAATRRVAEAAGAAGEGAVGRDTAVGVDGADAADAGGAFTEEAETTGEAADVTEEAETAGGAADRAEEAAAAAAGGAADVTEEAAAAGGAADRTEGAEAAGGAADMTEEAEAAGGDVAAAANIAAADMTEEVGVERGARGGAEGEGAADEADSEEEADADFGQPHVTTTSVVSEAEHRVVEAAEAAAEQERQHSIREAGGLLAGDGLVFRHPAEGTQVLGHRMIGESMGGEHSFEPGSACVAQQEWLPSSGELVVVAGAADGLGWLVAADGGRVPGVWAFPGKHLSRVFGLGVLGTVWDVDSDDEEVVVDAFHWPSPVELDHGDGWFQQDGLMGSISSHRKVRVIAVEGYSRGGEMLLVEDAEEVEHDEETDFDVDLDFDQERSSTAGDPLDEEPANTAGSGGGCVVEMAAANGNIYRMVKRSSVWVRKSSWDTLPLQ